MSPRIVLIFAAAGLLLVAGCGADAGSDRRTRVVAAFYPLAFAAEEIGADAVSVTNLTPAGAEPHDLELSARDVERVRDADLVLYVGQGFQPALERALEDRSGSSLDVLDGEDIRRDPHVWLDPARFARIARRIGAALGRTAAGIDLARRLEALDREYRRGLASCVRQEIVASHAAFGHLARRYGLRQIALTGIEPEAEPSARDLESLVRRVRESGATTVFFESLVSPKLAETVAREAGAETAVLDPLEGLTDAELERGQDYFTVMRDNLRALREALGCK